MQAGDIDKRHGARVRYANPVNRRPGAADHGRVARHAAQGI